MILDSGIKIQSVKDQEILRDKPNNFSQKLRKHLRNLYLDNIEQIGVERVVKLTFKGANKDNTDFTFYLFLELYSQGNIILTDYSLKILACLREHQYDENNIVKMNFNYPVNLAAPLTY